MAAATALLRRTPRLPLHSAARQVADDGTSGYSMAMHIHSSFSEQTASMESQLFQAVTNAVDVLWWTDHDHRMDGLNFRDTVHFTSLTGEKGAPGQGGAWVWTAQQSGPLSSSGGGIVTNPCSPNDPVAGGSLQLTAQSQSAQPASYGFYANSQPAGWNYRDNLTGQSLSIDVLLEPGWVNGYLELAIVTSYHEASGGRPAGDYSLSYQLIPPGGPATTTAQDNIGIISIPVQPASPGDWTTITITPSDDIATLWPDLDYRDFALWELTLSAVSTGDLVSGYFDYLQFNRTISGEAFLEQQADMAADLAPLYPGVVQQQGLEVSWQLPHINWVGGDLVIPGYGTPSAKAWAGYLMNTLIPQIQEAGGLVTYNHPFGYTDGPALPATKQNALLTKVAKALLPTASTSAALGCDLLEVGYPLRAGVDLAHHLALWDIMSRNAVFLTGNGTSDDHFGTDWWGIGNNWITSVWAASTGQADLLAALAAGRTWCGSLSAFGGGSLDLLVDGSCPMGSVSISSVTSRQIAVIATGTPADGSLQVLQGAVDYAGTSGLTANTQVIASYSTDDLAGGSVLLPVDTSADSFVRTQVLDPSGTVIGVSNPVWLLQSPPPNGVPGPRSA